MLASQLTLRVAARYVQAAYFAVNDIVLMGKYKNKRGKIVAFGADKWGNPTVEVEPIPKGRKQNKVFGLFKIWRADVKENVLKEQAAEAAEAARQLAEGVPPPAPVQNAPVAAGPLDLDDDDDDDDEGFCLVANRAETSMSDDKYSYDRTAKVNFDSVLHEAAAADEAATKTYLALHSFKAGLDAMEEVPNFLKPIYNQTMKALSALHSTQQETHQLRMMVRSLPRR
jgi:hypothetical protein